jgi:hypothetical protein
MSAADHRYEPLDEASLRRRIEDWTTGADHVLVPVALVDRLLTDLSTAREAHLRAAARAHASQDVLRAWGNALLALADALGVTRRDPTTAPESIRDDALASIRELQTRALLLETHLFGGLR